MKAIRLLVVLPLLLVGGCAMIPPRASSLLGTHTAPLAHNLGTSVSFYPDGSYQRRIHLFYSEPLVIETEDGKEEVYSGWTNTETGTWRVSDRAILLKSEEREIQNPNVEELYFDAVRSYPITYKFPRGWVLIYPSWNCVIMKKTPNQPLQRNASTEPVSNLESPARRG